MTMMRLQLLPVVSLMVAVLYCTCGLVMVEVNAALLPSIKDLIQFTPELQGALDFSQSTSFFQQLDSTVTGGMEITMILPTNEAFEQMNCVRKKFLQNNEEDLNTMMMFATAEPKIDKVQLQQLAKDGASTYSLISQEIQFAENPDQSLTLCALSPEWFDTPTLLESLTDQQLDHVINVMNDSQSSCADMVDFDFEAAEGFVHTVNKVLYPHELEAIFVASDLGYITLPEQAMC